jgi:hypothetical protein
MREEAERRKDLSSAREAGEDARDQTVLDEAPTADVETKPYVPAQTWDGLRHIGHRGHWKDVAPTEADEYQPYVAET